jgi:hypothetical protein
MNELSNNDIWVDAFDYQPKIGQIVLCECSLEEGIFVGQYVPPSRPEKRNGCLGFFVFLGKNMELQRSSNLPIQFELWEKNRYPICWKPIKM